VGISTLLDFKSVKFDKVGLIICFLVLTLMVLPDYTVVLIIFGLFILVSILITVKRRYSMRNSIGSELPIERELDLEGEQFAGESQAKLAQSQTQW